LVTMTPQTQMTAAAAEQATVEAGQTDGSGVNAADKDGDEAEGNAAGGSHAGQAGSGNSAVSESGGGEGDAARTDGGVGSEGESGGDGEDADGTESGDKSDNGSDRDDATDDAGEDARTESGSVEESGDGSGSGTGAESGATEDADGATEDVTGDSGDEGGGDSAGESLSENELSEGDAAQESVSGNDMTEDGVSIMSLLAAGDNIDSGTYGDITWVVDADGKLTVEGTGEFAASGGAPWTQKFNTRGAIKSAEIRVSGMKDASGMFNGCYRLTNVSFAGSDLSMLENMSKMFYGCNKLESIDFGEKLDTGNVTDMSYMFDSCYVLEKIALDSFDTKNVTNMKGMFRYCGGFEELNLSGWDTAKVTDMSYMFYNCGFDKITLGGRFTTHNVTDMSYVFAGESSSLSDDRRNLNGLDLAWLDLSGIKSNKVFAKLSSIFGGCNVGRLDLSRLDTSKTTTLAGLFAGCDMTGVDFSGLRTDTITDMSHMFEGCTGTIDLHTLNTENVTDMSLMFTMCRELKTLDVSGLNTRNVIDMYGMFDRCTSLESIDLSSLDMGNVIKMTSMFGGCQSLTEVQLGNLGSALEELDGEGGEFNSPVYAMFHGCSSLNSIDLSRFDFDHLKSANMFLDCTSLTTIRTPYNISFDCTLPDGTWYMADGTTTTVLPKDLSYSVLLQKGSRPAAEAERLEASKRKTEYVCGDTVTTDDLTVRYHGTDGSVRKLAAGEYTVSPAAVDTSEPGSRILTVTYQKDGVTLTAEVALTIVLGLTEETTTVTLAENAYTYDGQPKEPVPTVTYTRPAGGSTVTLAEGTDYTVSYRNNINAYEPQQADTEDGSAAAADPSAPTVIIKGAGSYSGTVTETFAIGKAAAPAAEELAVTASQCTEAREDRTTDLSGSFADYGRKTGYEVVSVDDPENIFSKTPVTEDIQNGVLNYGTKAAQEGSTASITVKVSFANYGDALLTVRITMAAKKAVTVTGITTEDTVYNGAAVSYSGTPSVKAEDGTDVTGQVTLTYRYSGTQADGTAYPEQDAAPVNAGSYTLAVAVSDDNPDYTGSSVYPFTISPAAVTVKAGNLFVPMGEGQGASMPVQGLPFTYETKGLLNGDSLLKEPEFTVMDIDAAGDRKPVTQIGMTEAGVYEIIPSGADAGMNYVLTYEPGTLTVSEERVTHTVSFDLMGHGTDFTKGGITAGSLLELTEAERTPEAAGYLFVGWYKDKGFAAKSAWDFATDTVQ
ncbi:MAG: BspA family leucine-rich repeat surface protein, partial [Lachnospiraceae bacterium]|nr:BspA family leucine-rich repeat surface protein [Lachnospiraceae bacterium]